MRATVSLVVDRGRWFHLHGGDAKGRDSMHELVSSWPGWRRMPHTAAHAGQPCSVYRAKAWTAQALSLCRSPLELAWTPEARQEARALIGSLERAQQALKRDGEPVALFACRGGRPPMRHQVQMLAAIHALGAPILLREDMGLGKTTTALLAWRKLSACRRLLVVCPKSVKLNWLAEAGIVLGQEQPRLFLIDGTASARADTLAWMRATANEGGEGIAVINYDLLRSLPPTGWGNLEQWVAGQALVCDEFHYCKDKDSKRTAAVRALAELAAWRMGLTGTPVRNTVEDLFSQIEILRPGTWTSYHDFANRHLVVSRQQFANRKRPVEVVRGGKNLEALNEVVNTISFGRKKDEVLTLPPKVHSKPLLELDGHHLTVYKAMKEEARVALEKLAGEQGEEVAIFHPVARSALEAAMRCEQIAQGFLSALPEHYLEENAATLNRCTKPVAGYLGARVFPDAPKLAWLDETLESLQDRRVVVFSRFNAPLYYLTENYEGAVLLVGNLNPLQREERITAFRKGEARILCCQVKLAEGFNLTESQDVIFLGRDWSPAINQQAEARCHRIGTQGTVNIQIPIVQNTIERLIDKKLEQKDADAQQALRSVTVCELMEAL